MVLRRKSVKAFASRTMARRKAVVRRSKTARLARFNNSRKRYVSNRRIAKKTSQYSETKLIKVKPLNEVAPQPIQVGAICNYWGAVIGNLPTGWDPAIIALDGISTVPGVAGNERVGNYVYFKKTHISMQVDMNAHSTRAAPPIQFRMVVCKARRANTPAGLVDLPQNSLFIDEMGASQGYATSGVNGMDMMNQPLNKRDWVIAKDRKFTLSSPDEVSQSGYNGKYPSRKDIKLDLKYFAKTRIQPITDQIEDLDTHYLIFLFASAIGKDLTANNWEVSLRGTTSFTDN